MSPRRTSACLLVAAVLAVAGWVRAQTTATDWRPPMAAPEFSRTEKDAAQPRWIVEPLQPANRSHIVRILEGQADVVSLDSGYYQGFRNGVVCNVERNGTPVARLLVVAAKENSSAALITYQPDTVIIVPGDIVRLSAI